MTELLRRIIQLITAALLIALSTGPNAASQMQASPFPSGPLVFRVSTAQFRAEGTFVIESSIEGLGTLRASGQWRVQSGIVELIGYDTTSNMFEKLGISTRGCDTTGRYRYEVDGAHVRFDLLADDCTPRRLLFDRSRWRPAGTADVLPIRRIVRTAAQPMPALPRATDARGSWPSFRGSRGSGVADGQNLPDRWNVETREHVLWRTPIPGLAHSSPIIWGDRLFVTSAISSRGDATFKPGQYDEGAASEDRSRHRWMLYALDRWTGKILWERTVHKGEPIDKREPKNTYASATPATDGRIVVAWFGSQGIYAYTVDGNFLWKVDVGRVDLGAYETPSAEWGPASSPIIWNDLVILQLDAQENSCLLALTLETGEMIWKTERDERPSWSTPIVVTTMTGAELVTNASTIRGYDPRTGHERWRLGGGSNIPVTTPILGDGLFVIATAGLGTKRPIFAVRPGARGNLTLKDGETSNASVVWSRTGRGPFIPTPLAYRGLLYVLGSNGVFDAYDLKTGEEIYRERLPEVGSGFSASPVAADGKIYLANEDGQIIIISAGREHRHIATNPMGELVMATPALSRGVMYVRGVRSVIAIGEPARLR
jgi:outer membrane protein assembly factor BamB